LADGEPIGPAWGAAGAVAGGLGGVEAVDAAADAAPAAGAAADGDAWTGDGVAAGVDEAAATTGGALPPAASSAFGVPLADFAAVLRCAEADDATGGGAPPAAGARAGCSAEPIASAPAIKSPGIPTTHRAKRSGRFAAESMILANTPGVGTGCAGAGMEAVGSWPDAGRASAFPRGSGSRAAGVPATGSSRCLRFGVSAGGAEGTSSAAAAGRISQ